MGSTNRDAIQRATFGVQQCRESNSVDARGHHHSWGLTVTRYQKGVPRAVEPLNPQRWLEAGRGGSRRVQTGPG
eukprot:4995157-Prymnesium_polylepis.1